MALTESNMMELGTEAPNFTLPDVISGQEVTMVDGAPNKGTLLIFMCNHCPYVIHVLDELLRLGRDTKEMQIRMLGINSNDVEAYPDDSPENMQLFARDNGFDFPYLFDATQEVAKAYDAACTPDIYLFDSGGRLYYRGRLDGSRPGNDVPSDGNELRTAIDYMLEGKPAPAVQHPSAGCNIKWKR